MRILSLLVLSATAAAAATLHTHIVHEKREVAPKKWIQRDDLHGSHVLLVRIALKQRNLDKGHDILMDIANPHSANYSRWYSEEEITDLFAPSKKTLDSVRSWLIEAGVGDDRLSVSPNKQFLKFSANVTEAEVLFRTKFHNFEHADSGAVQVACHEYSLPKHVQKHVDYVHPGLRLMTGGKVHTELKQRSKKKPRGFRTHGNPTSTGPILGKSLKGTPIPNINVTTDLPFCSLIMTPPCIRALYNVPPATKAAKGNELGIFESDDYYAAQDLLEFFLLFAPNIPLATKPILRGINGGSAPGVTGGIESDLDLQIAYPIIYPQQEVLFQVDDPIRAHQPDPGFFNTFLDAIDGSYCTFSAYGLSGDSPFDPQYPDPNPGGYKGQRMCGTYKPTNVISISYGTGENDLPTNYQQRQCAEMMKLGMRGVTIVIATGDSGVASRPGDGGNENGCLGPKGTVFNPGFPVSCPYVTAVGSTFLPLGSTPGKDSEVATLRFPSGGGFSNIYPVPSYQKSAVSTFFAKHDPGYPSYSTQGTAIPSNATTKSGTLLYNRAGRGLPDVAALGDNVAFVNNGIPWLIGGTSASTPVVAAIFNRVNEERIAAGKKPVGFVNPVMYAHPGMFRDVTAGSNPGCGTGGFKAVEGWDPVTGLGTPDYPKMLDVFMGLP